MISFERVLCGMLASTRPSAGNRTEIEPELSLMWTRRTSASAISDCAICSTPSVSKSQSGLPSAWAPASMQNLRVLQAFTRDAF